MYSNEAIRGLVAWGQWILSYSFRQLQIYTLAAGVGSSDQSCYFDCGCYCSFDLDKVRLALAECFTFTCKYLEFIVGA